LIVVDASACVSYVTGDEDGDWARSRIRSQSLLHAPHLIDFEVVSALRAFQDRRRVSAALQDFAALRLLRYPGAGLLSRIWELRGHVSAYDASYVALAEMLGLPLVTTDRRLARAGGHRASVEAPD